MKACRARIGGILLGLALSWAGAARGDRPRERRPVGLALSGDGRWLFAANSKSGTLSMIETGSGHLGPEVEVGRGLADVVALPDGRHLLALDRVGDALVIVAAGGGSISVESRVGLAPDPASVLVAPDGRSCVVASTRSRRLTVVTLGEGVAIPGITRTIDLPFPPRNLAWIRPGSKLVAADAFGGRIAVVDPDRGEVGPVRSLNGHNIRGLALTPDGQSLAIAHQTLNPLARSSFEDIHWGALLKNQLRLIRVDALLSTDPVADIARGVRRVELGRAGDAAGDPGAVAFDARGGVAVLFGGVDQVAFGPDPARDLRRFGVGRKPSALAIARDGKLAFVAEELDDAIAVLDLETGKLAARIDLGPEVEPGPVARGERLFSDARLSHDGWMSCRSCHPDGQTNGLVADTLGDLDYGAPKLTPSLLGVGSTGPWTWLGKIDRLEDQVRKSIETSMRGPAPTDAQVADLTAYLRSLAPPPPSGAQGEAIGRGREAFEAKGCASCHAGLDFTSAKTFDVQIADEMGHREFNPPSLRGVGGREPLLHDGRAADLGDLFRRHRHPRGSDHSAGEVDDLIAYLRSL